jgi:hypothetical protein
MKLAFSLFVLALPGFAAQQTMTGQISDSMCNGNHAAMDSGGKKMDAHECALACIKAGGKYVFVSGGKVYAISNQSLPDLSTHAGHTVKMTGDVSADGKSVTVSKVEM